MSPYRTVAERESYPAELAPAGPRWGATWRARAWAKVLRLLGARMPLARRIARDETRYRLACARYPAELAAAKAEAELVPVEWIVVDGIPRLRRRRPLPLPPLPPLRYVWG